MGSKNKLKKSGTKTKPDELDNDLFESDDTFVFISGYTLGGFSYGIAWEEMEEIERRDKELFGEERNCHNDEESDLPFY